MSVNIQTANGLKSLTGEKLTSSKVVSALGYTPANTNDLQKYLTITDATSTYASISYVDTKWNEAITIIESNFVSKQQEATANELGLVKISADKQDIAGAQNLDTSVPTVYAVQQYFMQGAEDTAESVYAFVAANFVSKADYTVDSKLDLYSTNPVQNKVIATNLQNIETDIADINALLSAYEARIKVLEDALGTAMQMLDELNGEVI